MTITNYSNKQVTLVNGKVLKPGAKLHLDATGDLLAQIKSLESLGIVVVS
jgi:hypothetical protein